MILATATPGRSNAKAFAPRADGGAVVRTWGDEMLPASSAAGALVSGCAVVVCTYKRPQSIDRFLSSLHGQVQPAQLIIVDASPDAATEEVLDRRADLEGLAKRVLYLRVTAPQRGLTKQRNVALRHVRTDLVAFFDDDVVLGAGCLAEMVGIHRAHGQDVVGVGTFSASHVSPPSRLWRLRRTLGIVSALEPGRYCRSGMSIPWSWNFVGAADGPVEGDWLPGYAMSWKTLAARRAGFDEVCGGYGQGEDLEFSLRLGRVGKLLMTSVALVDHLDEPAGRPRQFAFGYMAVYNRYRIHRQALTDRTWRDVVWFAYAWSLDTLMLTRGLLSVRSSGGTLAQIAGRVKAACDIVTKQRQA